VAGSSTAALAQVEGRERGFVGRVLGTGSARLAPLNLLNENQCSESVIRILIPILNTEHHRRSMGRARRLKHLGQRKQRRSQYGAAHHDNPSQQEPDRDIGQQSPLFIVPEKIRELAQDTAALLPALLQEILLLQSL